MTIPQHLPADLGPLSRDGARFARLAKRSWATWHSYYDTDEARTERKAHAMDARLDQIERRLRARSVASLEDLRALAVVAKHWATHSYDGQLKGLEEDAGADERSAAKLIEAVLALGSTLEMLAKNPGNVAGPVDNRRYFDLLAERGT